MIKAAVAHKPVAHSRGRAKFAEIMKHAYIIGICFFIFYPLVMMLLMSVKSTDQIIYEFFGLSRPIHFENYSLAWSRVSPLVMNSVVMSVGSSVLSVLVATVAGYAFAKLEFPFKKTLFAIVFAKMFLPGIMNLVPSFVLAMDLNLLDSYWAVILFAVAGSQPYWVFVMRTFISQQPQELFDAARVDGANEITTYIKIAMPLLKPMITLMVINIFIGAWNDYIWPLVVMTSPEKRPLTVGLAFLTSSYPGDYGPLTAGYVLASIPLLLLFLVGMRYFVEGLTAGSIKL